MKKSNVQAQVWKPAPEKNFKPIFQTKKETMGTVNIIFAGVIVYNFIKKTENECR